MYRFIESICVRDGMIRDPEGHLRRIGRTLEHFYGRFDAGLFWPRFELTPFPPEGKYKWRLVYDRRGIFHSEIKPYSARTIRKIRLVNGDDLDYAFKFLDRSRIDDLFEAKGQADDILIVKNGYITDASYANVILWDGHSWWTPDRPLLAGTQREKLLKEGRIRERPVLASDLRDYKKIKLINAMLSLEEGPELIIDPITII